MEFHQKLQSLLEKYDGAGPRYTSYPPIPYWSDVDAGAVAGWLAEPREGGDPSLSLYTHIPFCRSRCHYCGCFVIITPHRDPAERYLQAVHREMELTAECLGPGTPVRQYHLGGGTPNFISMAAMGKLVDKANALFPFEEGMEMSLEVDPRHLGRGEVKALAALGFNRISLGVQDFDEAVQVGVNRVEPFEHVAGLMDQLRGAGFGGINFDLIYGLPHQNRRGFEGTMKRVLQLRPHRLALYNFAYLPQAFPHQRKMDAKALPGPEEKLAIFLLARELLLDNGYVAMGMDHFALASDELSIAYENGTMRRNFMGYTTRAGADLLAFGVSGISEFNGRFWQNEKKLAGYHRLIDAGTLPAVRGMALDREDRLRQAVIAALFCQGGLNFPALEADFGGNLKEHLAPQLERLAPLSDDGLVELDDGNLRVTELGRFFLRNIAMVFDRHLEASEEPPVQFSRTV